MSQVRIKVVITDKNETFNGKAGDGSISKGFAIKARPVTNGSKENEQFFKWTPGGEISLGTVNENAAAALEVGKEYYVDFHLAEAEPVTAA